MNRAECFMDACLIISLIQKWILVHRKFPLQIQKLHKTCFSRRKRFSKTSEEMPSKLLSNTKRNMIKKPMPQNLNNLIAFTFYSQKPNTKEAKFPLQIFGGMGHISLKKYYRTIFICYAKSAPIRRKHFIE